MSDTENDEHIPTNITPSEKPKKLKQKIVSESDDDGETLNSQEERSEDEESMGSLVDFIAEEDFDKLISETIPEDETQALVEEAKQFLGNETNLNVKVKNGRVLRGNPKTTESQRQYWTRRIVYLQCLDDLNCKVWKSRGKELGITNLKNNLPEKVDINGNISNEKWDEFTDFYNDLKDKLFGNDSSDSEDDCLVESDSDLEEDECGEDDEDDDDDDDEDDDEEDDEDEDDDDEDDDDEDDDEDKEDLNKNKNDEKILEEDDLNEDDDTVNIENESKFKKRKL